MEDFAQSMLGCTLAGFRILAILGYGNNGVVFRARQMSLDREVALKLLLPELARTPGYAARFIHEARLAARLDHPNIIQALDAGVENDVYFFAMELVEGRSLEDIRVEQPELLTVPFVLARLRELAMALDYAWRKHHMSHGDIKPGNLMIRASDSSSKLADLGLARISGTEQTDEIMATPMYAAPEVIKGDRKAIGIRSDMYSFGVMLYELCAGVPPFDGETEELLQQHLHNEPLPLEDRKPGLNPQISSLISHMMEKNPVDRPESWSDIAEEIREIEIQENRSRLRPTAPPLPEKNVRKNISAGKKWHSSLFLLLASLLLLISAVLLGFLGFWGYQFFWPSQEKETPHSANVMQVIPNDELAKKSTSSIPPQPEKGEKNAGIPHPENATLPPPSKMIYLRPESVSAPRKEIPTPNVSKATAPVQVKQKRKPKPLRPRPSQTALPQKKEERPIPDIQPNSSEEDKPISRKEPHIKQWISRIRNLDSSFESEWKNQTIAGGEKLIRIMLEMEKKCGLAVPAFRNFSIHSSGRSSRWRSGTISLSPQTPPEEVIYSLGCGWYPSLIAQGYPRSRQGEFAGLLTYFLTGEFSIKFDPGKENQKRIKQLKSLEYFLQSIQSGKLKELL